MVVHALNLRIWEAEVDESVSLKLSGQDNQGYTEKPCLEKQKTKQNKQKRTEKKRKKKEILQKKMPLMIPGKHLSATA